MLENGGRRPRAFASIVRSLAAMACIALCMPLAFAQIDRGTIQGSVKDASGAAVPGAKVQIIQIETNSTIDLSTNEEGLFLAPNLVATSYKVSIQKEGFSTFVREPVVIRAREQIRVDAVLQTGSVSESINVTAEAPLLDTAPVNNSSALSEELIKELPMIVVGTKRDITGFLNNLPGTTQTNTFIPSVNGAPMGATEAFIDGAPASERIMRGAISENGPALEQVGEVSVVTGAFNAEYGGFGSWFTNVTIKSGNNAVHGSIFDHLGNDKLNARSFFQPTRTPYRQNEGGFTFSGPVVIPGVYNGHDKTFFFGSLGVFFARNGASNTIMTVPTQKFVNGDFSALTGTSGAIVPVYDPATTTTDGSGNIIRTAFVGNVIPTSRISAAGKLVAQYMPAPVLNTQSNNYYSKAAATWPYYNTWTPIIKIDHSISTKQKLQGSWTAQRRPRIIRVGGLSDPLAWGATQTNPLDNYFDQTANSWKLRLNHDYVFTPTLLNHITLSADRYQNLGQNKTQGQGWDTKLGITGLPSGLGEFPLITFSDGVVSLPQFNNAYDENWRELRYSVIENLTFIRGKHSMKFGAELSRDRVNRLSRGGASGTFAFNNGQTSLPSSANKAALGNAYASFLLGGVNTASAYIPVTTGIRFIRYALFAQDEFRISDKLTMSYGLRWDYQPPYNEVNNKLSSFVPNVANTGAGGRLGVLGFTGTGTGRIGGTFVDKWKKGFGPRIGFSYQANKKTVVRASTGIYYANWGSPMQDPYAAGFSSTPSFSVADQYADPLYYLGSGTFPQNFARPPALDPTFRNGQSISYLARNGARMPQTINWTFSVQRQVTPSLSLEATYLGSRSTHTSYTVNYDYMPLSGLNYDYNTLKTAYSSTTTTIGGVTMPFSGFQNQTGANTLYQALRPYPQYTDVSSSWTVSDSVGQQKFNSLTVKVNKRFSDGMTVFGYVNWMKSFTLATDQYPGSRFMQLDSNPALTFSASWAYDLPFGKKGSSLRSSSRAVNAVIGGWKVNGMVKYNSGAALGLYLASFGNLGNLGYSQWGNAVAGVSPYATTNPRKFQPATDKYLNSAAFSFSTGYNFGNLAPSLSWVRGFWGKSEQLTLGRKFAITEKLKLDFSADLVNPFNFHRWSNPNTLLMLPTFGMVTAASDGRTAQINANLSF
jgi:hypothetical protein